MPQTAALVAEVPGALLLTVRPYGSYQPMLNCRKPPCF
jgi:hypothetical protein